MPDLEIRQDVLDALEFDPTIDAADIGVAVRAGIVTLTGHVPTLAQWNSAETITMRVRGVKAVAQEIAVRPAKANPTADTEIARRVRDLLGWNTRALRDSEPEAIQLSVLNGHVTLRGTVHSHAERLAAEFAAWATPGVKTVEDYLFVVN